jgi:hypothetical protein
MQRPPELSIKVTMFLAQLTITTADLSLIEIVRLTMKDYLCSVSEHVAYSGSGSRYFINEGCARHVWLNAKS